MIKDWLKKQGKVLIKSFIVFVVLIPLIINKLFKINSPIEILRAEWDASAALSFYGTLLAAAVAVYGVYLTIQYSQSNYKEDVRNRVLPFIVIDMLKTKSHSNLFFPLASSGNDEEQIEGYTEYKLQDYYCILESGKIIYKTGLSKEQKQLLDNGGFKWVTDETGNHCVVADDVCVPIEIENVGNGTAIQFRYGLNRKEISENNRRFLPVISLKVGNPILFHIFSEDCGKDSKNIGEYILSFYYEDIYANRYMQEFDVMIEYNEEKRAPMFSINMDHRQKLIFGRENNG